MRTGKAQLTRDYSKGLRLLSQQGEIRATWAGCSPIRLVGEFLFTPQAGEVLYDDISSFNF
jgi:hypothetical protein